MSGFIGIDTSNYTTSAAYADDDGRVVSEKQLLSVKQGQRGLRQSDALFLHTVNLPGIIERLGKSNPSAVGYSGYPRDCRGSYMPCFLAGELAARSIASVMGIPAYKFSHQAGHIAAAVYSCGNPELNERDFIAFHVSGGTTEMLYVKPCEKGKTESGNGNGRKVYDIEKIGGTIDLNAGQAIDRTGVRIGLSFPCGPALEKLAYGAMQRGIKYPAPKICVNGLECNLSGLENLADNILKSDEYEDPASAAAAYAFDFIKKTLEKLTVNARKKYGGIPVLYAGGVMSSFIIKEYLESENAYFADPKFSSDNAAGTALMCRRLYNEEF